MPLGAVLSCCLNEFPTGIIIIAVNAPDNKPNKNIHQIIYSNNFAKRLFHINPNQKGNEMISEFKKEISVYHKREFDKLTNVSLYDVLFGNEEIKESGDSFFSETNMIFVKLKFCLNYILLSIDNLKKERDDIRNKLLKSISYQHLNTLHHELNNPLNSLINTVEQIKTHLFDRLKLSVFLIKTVIKKFILYNKNIFDDVLFDLSTVNLFNMEYIFQRMAKKFIIAYRYKKVTLNIDREFSYLKNLTIRSEPYYLKEFLRNIFLYLYYEVPKHSRLKITYNFLESNSLLSMSFQIDNSINDGAAIKKVSSDKNLIDLRGEDFFLDNNNKVKSIEISKEILFKIARALNCSISFPENEKMLFVVEFSDVFKDEGGFDEIYEDINEINQTVSEFEGDTKNITEIPTFAEMATFSYLDITIKGVGKESSKIMNQSYKTLLNNTTLNSVNSMQESRDIAQKSTGNSSYNRNVSLDNRKLVNTGTKLTELCQKSTFDRNVKTTIKQNDMFKRRPTLHNIVKICEKMKDPIIDNMKPTVVNSYFHENSALGNNNAWASTKYASEHYKNTLFSVNEVTENTKRRQSFKLITYNTHHSSNNNNNTNKKKLNTQKNKTLYLSNKKIGTVYSTIDFESYKTKEFPSKHILQITPSVRNILNTSFSNANSSYKCNGNESDEEPEIIEAPPNNSPKIMPTLTNLTLDKYGLSKPDILLVDDEEFNLMTMQSLLKLERVLADTATNGEEAVSKVEQNPNYKLIFMDVYMPVMDGIQACKLIEEKLKNGYVNDKLTIVIVSAHSKETVMSQIDNLTCVKKFVQKPLARKKLKAILQDYYY